MRRLIGLLHVCNSFRRLQCVLSQGKLAAFTKVYTLTARSTYSAEDLIMAGTPPGFTSGQSRTVLWCVPRSVSTAFCKCLSAIDDMEVWIEPFTYCQFTVWEYEKKMKKKLPLDYHGNEETYRRAADIMKEATLFSINPESLSYATIKQQLEAITSPRVFVKDMGYAPQSLIGYLPDKYKHTFLIRHPIRVFSSYRKTSYTFLNYRGLLVSEDDFDMEKHDSAFCSFFEELHKLWRYIRQNVDSHPIVIDGDDLITNPAEILPKYCRAVGLPYQESLLKWDKSLAMIRSWRLPSADILTNDNFYERAMQSSEFLPSNDMPRLDQLHPDVTKWVQRSMPFYEEMFATRIC